MNPGGLNISESVGGERVHQDAAKVTDGEIETYYHDHIADYKTISYDYLRIPKQKQLDPASEKPNDPDLQKKREASEPEMKAEADNPPPPPPPAPHFPHLPQD